VAAVHHGGNGNVPDEMSIQFSRNTLSPQNGNRQRGFNPFTCFLT